MIIIIVRPPFRKWADCLSIDPENFPKRLPSLSENQSLHRGSNRINFLIWMLTSGSSNHRFKRNLIIWKTLNWCGRSGQPE